MVCSFQKITVEKAYQQAKSALSTPSEEVSKLSKIFESKEIQQALNPTDRVFNANLIVTKAKLPLESLHKLYELGQLNYNMGKYKLSYQFFQSYLLVCSDPARYLATMWGLLAGFILDGNYLDASEQIVKLSTIIESTSFPSASHALMQRCWLLHWSLFVYFNHEIQVDVGLPLFLEFFLKPNHLNAIETECPWLLRYMIVASSITGQHGETLAKSASQQKYHAHYDPFVAFLEALLIDVNLEKVAVHLQEIQRSISEDSFLFPIQSIVLFHLKKWVFNEIASFYSRITIDKLAYYMAEPDPLNLQLNYYISEDQGIQVLNEENLVVFPKTPEGRREILGKIDLITHTSSHIMASLYKQERKGLNQ
ncbi:Eukaryotic translation initiation factor 3 subunit E [Coelomomyces lativittatus]|nr:Eukaryotic translation initiation factor 3 subunit E [Coelomomyces lativittatus]